MKLNRLSIAVAAFLAVAFVACSKSDSSNNNQASYVSFVNAAPKTSLQILLGGTLLAPTSTSNLLPFPQYLNYPGTIAYANVLPGIIPVQVSANGSTTAAYGNLYLAANTYYSVYIYDTLKNDSLKALYIKDNFDSIAPATCKIRFLQMSPSLPSVDVFLNDSLKVFQNIPYVGNMNTTDFSSLSTYTAFAGGTYSVKICPTGTLTPLITSSIRIDTAHAYTIFAKGLTGGKTVADSLGIVLIPQ